MKYPIIYIVAAEIDSTDKSKAGEDPIRFFRGVTGRYLPNSGCFSGYPKAEIKEEGIFLGNDSPEQNGFFSDYPDEDMAVKVAPGLLVHATLAEAAAWIINKSYLPRRYPFIGILEFSLDYFKQPVETIGIRVFRHFPSPKIPDEEISPAEILKGALTGGGEYFLQGRNMQIVPEEIRKGHERLLVPRRFTPDRVVNFAAGFREI